MRITKNLPPKSIASCETYENLSEYAVEYLDDDVPHPIEFTDVAGFDSKIPGKLSEPKIRQLVVCEKLHDANENKNAMNVEYLDEELPDVAESNAGIPCTYPNKFDGGAGYIRINNVPQFSRAYREYVCDICKKV